MNSTKVTKMLTCQAFPSVQYNSIVYNLENLPGVSGVRSLGFPRRRTSPRILERRIHTNCYDSIPTTMYNTYTTKASSLFASTALFPYAASAPSYSTSIKVQSRQPIIKILPDCILMYIYCIQYIHRMHTTQGIGLVIHVDFRLAVYV